MTGSFTPVLASPGSTVSRSLTSNSAGCAASVISTRQCMVPVVAQLTNVPKAMRAPRIGRLLLRRGRHPAGLYPP